VIGSCDEGRTYRANERAPLADSGTTWRRNDIVKDNGPGCLIVLVGVILIGRGSGDSQIAKQYGTVVVDEEISCFDIPVYKSVDVQITMDGKGAEKRLRGGR